MQTDRWRIIAMFKPLFLLHVYRESVFVTLCLHLCLSIHIKWPPLQIYLQLIKITLFKSISQFT